MKRILLLAAVMTLSIGMVAPTSAAANPERAAEIREEARKKAAERREDKEARIADIKARIESRKLTLTQERCEAREEKLQKLVPKLANSASRLKTVIDKKYDQVQDFYESGQLTVDNYQVHVEAIELAKANAEASLEAVANYEIEVDCDQLTGLGEQLDGFRTAVKDARDNLKEYRKSLVDLISSLRSAAAETETGDEAENTDAGGEE